MLSSDAATRSGVRRFWLRALVFGCGLALAWAGLEVGLAHSKNSYALKRERLHALAGQIDTLILGSSETYYGIPPHELSGTAFNLANWSQSLYFDYELTRRVLPELPKLKRAIVLVNYMSLYTELYDHPESWRQYEYYRVWGIPLQRSIDYWDLRLISRVALYSPHSALEAMLQGFNGGTSSRVDDRGWYRVPDEDRWGVDAKQAAKRLLVHHGFMRTKYLPENTAMLERLIALLRGHGVDVVMLTTPVWRTYQAGISQPLWQRAKTITEELAAKHGAHYLDFQDEPRLQAEDFEDPDHLNAVGAVHFAKILDTTLNALDTNAPRSGVEPPRSSLGG